MVASVSVAIWAKRPTVSTNSGTASQTPGVNLGPATADEKADAEQRKREAEERMKQEAASPTPTPATSQLKSVTPIISSWGQEGAGRDLEVAAFVGSVYEDVGTCVLTLTQGAKTVTRQTAGHKDVNRTSCTNFAVPYSALGAGSWEATVRYTSTTASGVSTKQPMVAE